MHSASERLSKVKKILYSIHHYATTKYKNTDMSSVVPQSSDVDLRVAYVAYDVISVK